MVGLFEGARRHKRTVFLSIVLGLLFWAAEFFYQFYVLIPGEFSGALVRGSALAAATLIGFALLTGPFARIFPAHNYIAYRRTLAVLGFTFGIVHVLAVLVFFFNFDFFAIFFELDPYKNLLLFGLSGFLIFIPLYLTSTDWAVQKMGFTRWKMLHRIVYLGYIFIVIHYIQINPELLYNIAGSLLLATTALVFMFELAAFIIHTKKRPGRGRYVGLFYIAVGALLFYLASVLNMSTIVLAGVPVVVGGTLLILLYTTYRDRKKKHALLATTQAPRAPHASQQSS